MPTVLSRWFWQCFYSVCATLWFSKRGVSYRVVPCSFRALMLFFFFFFFFNHVKVKRDLACLLPVDFFVYFVIHKLVSFLTGSAVITHDVTYTGIGWEYQSMSFSAPLCIFRLVWIRTFWWTFYKLDYFPEPIYVNGKMSRRMTKPTKWHVA